MCFRDAGRRSRGHGPPLAKAFLQLLRRLNWIPTVNLNKPGEAMGSEAKANSVTLAPFQSGDADASVARRRSTAP